MTESSETNNPAKPRTPAIGSVLTVVILLMIGAWAGIVWYRTGFQVKQPPNQTAPTASPVAPSPGSSSPITTPPDPG